MHVCMLVCMRSRVVESVWLFVGCAQQLSCCRTVACVLRAALMAGHGCCRPLQAVAKNIKWAQPPHLSVLQQNLSRVKGALR